MPTIVDNTIETVMSARVVIALGHICEMPFGPPFGICSTPNDETISTAKTAVRHDPASHAKTVAARRTPTHVIQWSALTTSFVDPLSTFPNPPTMVWRKKFDESWFVTQLSALSNQRGTPKYQVRGNPE
jgi:hypothetical protein